MARGSIGAIAHQSQADATFLWKYFEHLERGDDLRSILAAFESEDPHFAVRQIGMVTFNESPLSYTGTQCTPWAGHRVGEDYACQGNILVGPGVIDAMCDAFEQSPGPLHARLFAALSAGDSAGGDARGKQSASLRVTKGCDGRLGSDELVGIDILDHATPIRELDRILSVWEDRTHVDRLLDRFRQEASLEAKRDVLSQLRDFLDDKRSDGFLTRWSLLGQACADVGDMDRAVDTFRTMIEIQPGYRRLVERAAQSNEVPQELATQILDEAAA
jgi:uncharacterized Ntn-hydrolase superfamily protein